MFWALSVACLVIFVPFWTDSANVEIRNSECGKNSNNQFNFCSKINDLAIMRWVLFNYTVSFPSFSQKSLLRGKPHPDVLVADLHTTAWYLPAPGAQPRKDNCLWWGAYGGLLMAGLMLEPCGVYINGAINGFLFIVLWLHKKDPFWLLGRWKEAAGAALKCQVRADMGTDAEVSLHTQRDASSLAQGITTRSSGGWRSYTSNGNNKKKKKSHAALGHRVSGPEGLGPILRN